MHGVSDATLNREDRERLTKKVMFEQRHERKEEINSQRFLDEVFK